MSEFKAIETQEQLDTIISERIGRAKDSVRKEYEGWISPKDFEGKSKAINKKVSDLTEALNNANEKIKTHEKDIAEKDGKLRAYETTSVKTRIAHEYGLSYEAIDFIKGEDEESIKKSAEALKTLVGARKQSLPMKSTEPEGNGKNAALKSMLQSMNIGG